MSRQGSSWPDGALMLADRMLRSVSAICSETSLDVPTLSGATLLDSSSPAGRWKVSVGGGKFKRMDGGAFRYR